MRNQPEITLILTTFNKTRHLRMSLESIAAQRNVDGKFELVVVDDGSDAETFEIIDQYKQRVPFSVQVTTHDHDGFRVSQCRNEGVAVTQAPYLLFLDGDCMLPLDHVQRQLNARRKGWAFGSDTLRLSQEDSEQLTVEDVRSGEFVRRTPKSLIREMQYIGLKDYYYTWRRHPYKPKLYGNNIAMWRSDYEAINGFDENFVGWGCEDDDVRMRLTDLGVRIGSLRATAWTVHLWHPVTTCTPDLWKEGSNVGYLQRSVRLPKCANGLVKRQPQDLSYRVIGEVSPELRRQLPSFMLESSAQPAEVEIAINDSLGQFSPTASCRVVILTNEQQPSRRDCGEAQLFFSASPTDDASVTLFPLGEFRNVMYESLAGSFWMDVQQRHAA